MSSFPMQAGYEYEDDYDPAGQTRSHGLRRMSRLTWRATQLGAVATVGFAVLFARTAPAATVSGHPAAHRATATPAPGPTPSPSPSPSVHRHRRHHHHKPAATAPASAAAPAPSQSLAPPTTPPAPPPSSPTPSPVHTTSSPSHGGG